MRFLPALILTLTLLLAACAPQTINPTETPEGYPEGVTPPTESVDPAEAGQVDPEADVPVVEGEVIEDDPVDGEAEREEEGEEERPTPPALS